MEEGRVYLIQDTAFQQEFIDNSLEILPKSFSDIYIDLSAQYATKNMVIYF